MNKGKDFEVKKGDNSIKFDEDFNIVCPKSGKLTIVTEDRKNVIHIRKRYNQPRVIDLTVSEGEFRFRINDRSILKNIRKEGENVIISISIEGIQNEENPNEWEFREKSKK